MNRDVPLIPNLWKLIRHFKKLEATAMQVWRGQMNFVFVIVKPTSLSVCQVGAGILNNRRKGNKYHSARAKNDRICRVIMNTSFDLIESDSGNVYPARALRALGLLLADGAPRVGGGKTF